MKLIIRLLAGAGVFVLGYYLGRQISLSQLIRKDLAEKRDNSLRKLAG